MPKNFQEVTDRVDKINRDLREAGIKTEVRMGYDRTGRYNFRIANEGYNDFVRYSEGTEYEAISPSQAMAFLSGVEHMATMIINGAIVRKS
jgi:hypothetical protein